MESRSPPKRIILVAINIDEGKKYFEQYNILTPIKKIDCIAERIELVCKTLKETEPHSQIIITWRENGITTNKDAKAISREDFSYFKEKVKQIIKTFNHLDLMIVSGATSIYKKIPKEKLTTYLNRYKSLDSTYLDQIAMAERTRAQQQTLSEADLQIDWHKDKTQALTHSNDSELYAVYVSSIIVNGDEIQETRKIAPYEETERQNHLSPVVYRPTKDEHYRPVFFSQDKSKSKVTIGVEICRENSLLILASLENAPFIHILNSDFIPTIPEYSNSPYLFHVDSFFGATLVKIPENFTDPALANETDVVYYVTELMGKFKLYGPEDPCTPFTCKMLTLTNQIMLEMSNDPAERKALNAFKLAIYESISESEDTLLAVAIEQIVKYHALFFSEKIPSNAAVLDLLKNMEALCMDKRDELVAIQSTNKKGI